MKTKRRRGRTTLIVVAAAVLGVVAGTATGYAVQADRAPDALPPLNQPGLAYPAKSLPEGKESGPLTVAKSDDLLKRLISKPKGARKDEYSLAGDGALSLDAFTLEFDEPSSMFEYLAPDFRRGATVSWREGENHEVVVNLIEFKPTTFLGAADFAQAQQGYMPDADAAGNAGAPIEGTADGRYWVYDNPRHERENRARAVAWRGDIMMEISVYDSAPIRASEIKKLAERQMGRL